MEETGWRRCVIGWKITGCGWGMGWKGREARVSIGDERAGKGWKHDSKRRSICKILCKRPKMILLKWALLSVQTLEMDVSATRLVTALFLFRRFPGHPGLPRDESATFSFFNDCGCCLTACVWLPILCLCLYLWLPHLLLLPLQPSKLLSTAWFRLFGVPNCELLDYLFIYHGVSDFFWQSFTTHDTHLAIVLGTFAAHFYWRECSLSFSLSFDVDFV